VYVSPQYSKIQKLLDEVADFVPLINRHIEDRSWSKADELVWQCGVTLETCKNIMKAV
jgi:hypothetical protein